MAGDITTTITELLDNSDVQKKIAQAEAREKSLTKITAERGKVTAQVLRQELRDRDRAERGVMSFTQALSANAEQTGRMTAATGNLRAQFVDLAVQLQGGASPFTALSQQLPQIAEAAMGTTGALGSFASAVGAAAVPAGLLLTAASPLIPMYLDYSTAAKKAAESQQLWNQQADVGIKHSTMVRDAVNEALVATGVWTDEQGENTAIQNKWADALDGATSALWEEKRALEAQMESLTDSEGQKQELAKLNEERLKQGKEELKQINISSGQYEQYAAQLDAVNAEINKRTEQNEIGLRSDLMAAKARRDGAEALRLEAEAAREAAKARKEKTKAGNEEVVTLEEIIAQEERMAEQERQLAEQAARLHERQIDDWVDGVMKRREAEIKAAEEAAAAWNGFARSTQTMIGNLADFAGTMADKMADENEEASLRSFRIHQAAEVVEATISAVRIGEEAAKFAAKINPLLAAPAGLAAFAAAEAAYVTPIAQQKPPTFDDTPGVQRMSGSRNVVSLAGDDYFAAAKDPADLARQVKPFAPAERGGSTPTISTSLIVSGRTAQKITQAAKTSKRGYTIGQPVAGRRRTRY